MAGPIPRFFVSAPGGGLVCALCPHRCAIAPGGRGLCRVRANAEGKPALPRYGWVSAVADDPIEKKPLYHFRPGSRVFSAGFLSCNLRCPFCQNWGISQTADGEASFIEPRALVELARRSGTGAIAYTYSEPLVHAEYLIDAMEIARKEGLANVLVTNGCALEEPAREILSRCDAVNVDLKAFRADTYAKVLGGDLETVKGFIALAHSLGIHLEVTTLVVTGMNDTVEEITACAEYLSSLSPDIPYHLSAYRPEYRYDKSPTSPELLASCAKAARKRLVYVYVGNLAGEQNDTECPVCGARVVRRRGYSVETTGLEKDEKGVFRCRACGAELPFRD